MIRRPCMQLGCSELVSSDGYCPKHRRKKLPLASTGGADYDWRWQQQRAAWKSRHPVCAECQRHGRATSGKDVDHIIPFRGNLELLRAEWNLQTLCRRCHGRKTGRDSHWSALTHPMPGPTLPDLTVITGPPLAGKSTYSRSLGLPVLDLDQIYAELGASDPAMQSIDVTRSALSIRNTRLARAQHPMALIVAAPRLADRMFWSCIWGARVVLLVEPLATLEQRMGTRPMAEQDRAKAGLAHWLRTATFDADVEVLDPATAGRLAQLLENKDTAPTGLAAHNAL